MALETPVNFISDLVITNPTSSDPRNEGDDHIRNVKTAIKATFPNVTGAVTPTHTVLNYMLGVTSAVQTQLDAKAPLASPTFTGTVSAATITASARIEGNGGTGNGLGKITVSTSDASGGSQGDIWFKY